MPPTTGLLAMLLLVATSQANPLFGSGQREIPQEDPTGTKLDYRLPDNVTPLLYKIRLEPKLPKEFSYEGTVEVTIMVEKSTDTITLNAKDLTIDKKDVELMDPTNVKEPKILPEAVRQDPVREFLIIDFPAGKLQVKQYTLRIKFSGKLTDSKRGFYRSSYLNSDGERTWLAVTHFEPTGARLAFPCWDEPALKAAFEITIKHSPKYVALSNTPGNKKTEGDYIVTTFERTPKMSTYLVAFVVSDYQATGEGNFKVWTKEHAVESAKYALLAGQKILKELDTYTGIPYDNVMKKMDQISIPDFAPSAMENWGLVTYAEKALLYTEGVTTTTQKQAITTVIAHEFAHQWFGNLVTPEWWTYLWLSEGFATYFQYIITDKVEDSWRLMDQFVVKGLQASAFEKDAQDNGHPINNQVHSPAEIKATFDAIAYQKGACVIRMMSHVLTEKLFQTGLRQYLANNKFDAANSDKLLDHLQKVAGEKLPENVNLKTIMKEWLEKAGYPVVHVRRNKENGDLALTQERFSEESGDETKWWIPINYITEDDIDFKDTKPSHWLKPTAKELVIKGVNAEKFVLLNKQQTGFYRVNYDEANWQLLSKFLQSEHFGKIEPVNRAQLIDDALSLARIGKLHYSTALQVSDYLAKEKDYIPWVAVFRHVNFLSRMLVNSDKYSSLKEYFADQMKGIVEVVKFEAAEKDEHIHKLARPDVLRWACWFGIKECTDHVDKAFNAWLKNPTENKLDVDLKEHIMCVGVRNAEQKVLESMVKKYTEAAAKTQEKQQLLSAISCSAAQEELLKLLRKNLEQDKTGDEFDATMKAVLTNSPVGVQLGLDVINDNYTAIQKFDKDGSRMKAYINQIGSRVTTVTEYVNLGMLVARKKLPVEVSADGFRSAGKNLDWITTYSAPITTWMDSKRAKEENSAHSVSVSAAALIIPLFLVRLL